MTADNTDLNALSEKVLGAVFEVSNTLGGGFLEKVYQRALLRELSLRGIRAIARKLLLPLPTRATRPESTLPISLSKTCWWWRRFDAYPTARTPAHPSALAARRLCGLPACRSGL